MHRHMPNQKSFHTFSYKLPATLLLRNSPPVWCGLYRDINRGMLAFTLSDSHPVALVSLIGQQYPLQFCSPSRPLEFS